jgi:hypothetical protein
MNTIDSTSANASYPTNWSLHFLCDCKKRTPQEKVHSGIAKKLSASRVSILSDHSICHGKKLSLRLTIPPLGSGEFPTIITAIGHAIETVANDQGFLTEVEFLHFSVNGQMTLVKNLYKHFNSSYTPPIPHLK